jgi:signal transduction histidine kinase
VALKGGRLDPEMILELREKVASLMDGINRIIHDLRPPVLDDLGLESAIRWLLQRQLADKNIGYTITAEGIGDAKLQGRAELGLFRVLQEAVINITKHAMAGNVDISLDVEDGSMKVKVRDDGKGFDLDEVLKAHETGSEHGFGLMGMQERIANLDGEMHISSEPGKGTSIEISIPLGGNGEL